MKFLFILIFFFVIGTMNAQLGFCSGSKGDPIFHEDFGPSTGTGEALPAGITTYTFVKLDPKDRVFFSGQVTENIKPPFGGGLLEF